MQARPRSHRRKPGQRDAFGLLLAFVPWVSGCGETVAPELSLPSSLVLVAGDLQTVDLAPAQAPDSLVVRVVDPLQRGVEGVAITWAPSDPSGSVSRATTTTDRNGFASAHWTLGRVPGAQTLRVTSPRLPGASVVFRAENRVPRQIVGVSGHGQQVLNGPGPAPDSLVVRLLDAQGRPFSGVEVFWTTSDPTGSVNPTSTLTDADGLSRTAWTLGGREGAQWAQAMVPNLDGAVRFDGENVRLGVTGAVTLDPRPAVALFEPTPQLSGQPLSGLVAPGLRSSRRLIVRQHEAGAGLRLTAPDVSGDALARNEASLRASVARLSAGGLDVRAEISPAISALRIEVPLEVSLDAVLARLRADPLVADVWVDELLHLRGDARVVETPFVRGFGEPLANVPPRFSGLPQRLPRNPLLLNTLWHYNAIDAPRAWATTVGSANVLVAVVDDGIRFDHPGIAANLTADGYNFVSADDLGGGPVPLCFGGSTSLIEAGMGPDPTLIAAYNWNGECLTPLANGNHGLHVAGTIGGVGDDEVGIAGINWQVRIRPVRVLNVLGFGSWFDVAQGVLYAAGLPASNGVGGTVTAPSAARVINMSLGGGGADATLAAAVAAATAAGSLIVASAGNGSSSAPSYPAAFPQVLSVASVGPELQPAWYSNVGSTVDLAAPGGDFRSSAGVYSTTWNFQTGVPNYAYYQGTSMAAPHVAGVAALVLSREPNLTVAQLRDRLERTAVRLGPPGWDPRFGHGLVNAYNAVHNVTTLPRNPIVQVHDADSGARIALVRPGPDGTFSVLGLPPGRFQVVAGEEESGDGTFAAAGRRAGWFGAPNALETITLSADGTRIASTAVNLGVPHEIRPNGTFQTAHPMVVGGLVVGRVTETQTESYFGVRIPVHGIYTFETAGVLGTCGYGAELDTILTLFDAQQNQLAENDDTPMADAALCSRIQQDLAPGVYTVRVRGWGQGRGTFALLIRAGS